VFILLCKIQFIAQEGSLIGRHKDNCATAEVETPYWEHKLIVKNNRVSKKTKLDAEGQIVKGEPTLNS
jgi:hypothetical protein